MEFSISVNAKIKSDTYDDIVRIYDYLDYIFKQSSIKNDNYRISADIEIDNLSIKDLNKEDFINHALGRSSVILKNMSLASTIDYDIQMLILISYTDLSKITIISKHRVLIDEFQRSLEQNPIEEFESKTKLHDDVSSNVVNINAPITNANLAVGDGQDNTQSVTQVLDSQKERSFFEKYWFPLILALISGAAVIVGAILASK